MRCRHKGFHTITSSYDRGTRTLTYFRHCDGCGARLGEVTRLAYEPRFVATRVERWAPDWSIEASRAIPRDATIIEPPPKLSQDAGVRDAGDGGLTLTSSEPVFAYGDGYNYEAGSDERRMSASANGSPATFFRPRREDLMNNLNAPSNRPGDARVTHGLTLAFEEFGWESLESAARSDGETLDELLARAAAYFDAELPTARAAMLAPPFKPGGRGTSREIRLEVSRDCWERLQGEAERQGVSLERLLEHVALLYLADIDSGRVAERLLGRAEEEDEP